MVAESSFQLNWVVALKPEAQAVIERFGLHPVPGGLFPVFARPDGSMQLVLSGPGKVSAAAATAALASMESTVAAVSTGWVNFGIAGAGKSAYGSTFLAAKVQDRANGRAWYPVAAWPRKEELPRRVVETVDAPCELYPEGVLVDMEASGFYPVALKVAGTETVQVLKVVSDDPEHSIEAITRETARKLCDRALVDSGDWIDAFLEIGKEEAERLAAPPGFEEIRLLCRFSVTQQHQLRRLLQQRVARFGEGSLGETIAGFRKQDSRSILAALRREIHSTGSEFRHAENS